VTPHADPKFQTPAEFGVAFVTQAPLDIRIENQLAKPELQFGLKLVSAYPPWMNVPSGNVVATQ
jgi:hypothetical protein